MILIWPIVCNAATVAAGLQWLTTIRISLYSWWNKHYKEQQSNNISYSPAAFSPIEQKHNWGGIATPSGNTATLAIPAIQPARSESTGGILYSNDMMRRMMMMMAGEERKSFIMFVYRFQQKYRKLKWKTIFDDYTNTDINSLCLCFLEIQIRGEAWEAAGCDIIYCR